MRGGGRGHLLPGFIAGLDESDVFRLGAGGLGGRGGQFFLQPGESGGGAGARGAGGRYAVAQLGLGGPQVGDFLFSGDGRGAEGRQLGFEGGGFPGGAGRAVLQGTERGLLREFLVIDLVQRLLDLAAEIAGGLKFGQCGLQLAGLLLQRGRIGGRFGHQGQGGQRLLGADEFSSGGVGAAGKFGAVDLGCPAGGAGLIGGLRTFRSPVEETFPFNAKLGQFPGEIRHTGEKRIAFIAQRGGARFLDRVTARRGGSGGGLTFRGGAGAGRRDGRGRDGTRSRYRRCFQAGRGPKTCEP